METEMKIESLSEWGLPSSGKPLVIAGPCSAESEKQVMDTAIELAKNKAVNVFRAGIWKPRTRPGFFEGIGSEGLPWLKMVKQETGLPTAIEVANVKHVFEALKAGVDILWVGARTSVNPFAVQEIADAVSGMDIPIIVKNPVNPDLELWIGALERFHKVGITKLAALHRGFSGMEKSEYRNDPQWQIALDLRRRIPEIPLICDPSHIGGRRDLIRPISQKAMDLNFDGLMIETHINPGVALSDAKQQVTPASLAEILDKLILRNPNTDNADYLNTLEEFRTQIDSCDDQIIEMLGKRMEIVDEIGKLKKRNNVTVYQHSRWDNLIKAVIEKGKTHGLSETFTSLFFKAIHDESINHQEQILNQ